jgi:hypothetical protein
LSTNHITMKLTDVDLSSLAEVAAAITLLDSVHVRLATGGVPLPSLPPATSDITHMGDADLPESFAPGTRTFVVNPAPAATFTPQGPLGSGDVVHVQGLGTGRVAEVAMALPGLTGALAADPVTAAEIQAMDAASIFGGAPAQSAAPLPPLAPCTAGVAQSPTAPAVPPASGLAPLASPAPAPMPVASAAAPAAHAPQASPAGGVELDADGLPWDERIHAGTKRKNADGRWTAKRGINDPDLVPRVVAQLRAQLAAGGVTTQSAAPLPLSTPAPSMVPLAALPATSGLASLAAPTPPASLPQAAPPQSLGGKPAPTTFADFMTAATVEVQSGRLTALQFGEACKLYGGPAGLASNPAAIPTVWAALKAQHPGML